MVQVENEELLYSTGTGHFAGFFSTSGILRHNVAGATDTTALDAFEQAIDAIAQAIEQMRSGSSEQRKVLWCVADVWHQPLENARFATAAAHQSTAVTPASRSRSRFYSPMWSTRWTSPRWLVRSGCARSWPRWSTARRWWCSALRARSASLPVTGSWWCSAAGRRSALALAGLGALCQ